MLIHTKKASKKQNANAFIHLSNVQNVTEPPEWEDIQEDEDVVDLRGNHVTGGIFYFNLLNLPPQPKTVNSWIITRCKLNFWFSTYHYSVLQIRRIKRII